MSADLPKPPCTLAEIAALLPDAELVGDGTLRIDAVCHPRMVETDAALVLVLEAAAIQTAKQSDRRPVAALVAEELTVPDGTFAGYIKVKRPRHALVTLLRIFERPPHRQDGIHPSAVIDSSATVAPGVSVGAFTYVGPDAVVDAGSVLLPHVTVGAGARIGENCLLHPGARIGERVVLGKRVIIHQNACLGADGFSYVTAEPGSIEAAKSGGKIEGKNSSILKINSVGTVILEDDVEVGACATIDRSNVGATVIKKGTKIDNLVMIGHNNTIGENCMIVSQVGIAGSCQVGDRVVIAGQAGIGDHLSIGDDAIVMAKSGVMKDVAPREVVAGLPALPRREALQNVMYMAKLRELFSEMKTLKKKVAELEAGKTGAPV